MALDVYGLTRHRYAVTLNRFLDEYVERVASADRGDEELLLEPLDARPGAMEGEVEPSLTLSHILERGLAYPRRAFTAYLTCLPACRQAGIERVILRFTRDDQVVLGLSVSEADWDTGWQADEVRAKKLLARLAEASRCHLGLILLECPPPLSEAEFRHPAESLPVNFFATFDA